MANDKLRCEIEKPFGTRRTLHAVTHTPSKNIGEVPAPVQAQAIQERGQAKTADYPGKLSVG